MLPPGHRFWNLNYSYPITCACLRLLKCVLRDHNSNNCTHSDNVCCCTYMVNNDYDKFRSLYMTLFRHRIAHICTGRADRFLVSVSIGQVAAVGGGEKCPFQSRDRVVSSGELHGEWPSGRGEDVRESPGSDLVPAAGLLHETNRLDKGKTKHCVNQ